MLKRLRAFLKKNEAIFHLRGTRLDTNTWTQINLQVDNIDEEVLSSRLFTGIPTPN